MIRRAFLPFLVLMAVVVSPSESWAQELTGTDGEYVFYGVGGGWNSRVGQTVEVVFKVVEMPQGGLFGEAIVADIVDICESVASTHLDNFSRESDMEIPDYFTIALQTGSGSGSYFRIYFRNNMDCVPVKLSSLN